MTLIIIYADYSTLCKIELASQNDETLVSKVATAWAIN